MEDAFVIALKALCIIQTNNETNQKVVKERNLLDWLGSDAGIEFFQRTEIINLNHFRDYPNRDILARKLLQQLIENEWISPIETKSNGIISDQKTQKDMWYTVRLKPNISNQQVTSDQLQLARLTRESIWHDCFPTCPDSCKQVYFNFTNPSVILYSTLGLNLIGNGISSVAAFSKDLNMLQLPAEERAAIIGFLAKAFPM